MHKNSRVIRNEIKAYAPVIDSPMRSNLVARFDTEVEAGYAYFELFKSLKAGKRAWDPYTLKPLSTVWDKIDKHFDSDNAYFGLTGGAQISAFHLDKVTITYDRQVNRLLGDKAITECQKRVAKKLQELLGDASIEVKWTF